MCSPCLVGFAATPSVMMLDRCGRGCDPNSDSACPHALDDDAAEVLLYACKRIGRGEQLLLDYGEEYRGHDWSQARPQQVRVDRRCKHGRRRYRCKECGGASICKHNRQRSQCKECGGSSICTTECAISARSVVVQAFASTTDDAPAARPVVAKTNPTLPTKRTRRRPRNTRQQKPRRLR